MEITFDPAKRQATLDERGLDFERAGEVFEGRKLTLRDDRRDYAESRFQTCGYLDGRMVMTVWTPRNGARRIISMRHVHDEEAAEIEPRMARS